MAMEKKVHDISLTDHEISLIHTSLSNLQRDLINRFKSLKEVTEDGEEVWIGDYDRMQLDVIDMLQKKLSEI
ncbi:hypothetical protein AAIR29_12765 [Psychrobacter sp. FBL11]|uniref:Uncharacterized protein n=1 Tax=Psychrobacter saeujeotis TaxID=3143436 RepID=A0ABU9XAQ4_9GAMM|nr:hypothetical protein [uncultured Psychrobacter sp.]